MSVYAIEPATAAHCRSLAGRLRDPDLLECRAIGREPEDAILRSVSISRESWALTVDGEAACIFGHNPISTVSNHAMIWLFTGTNVPTHPIAFLKGSRHWVRYLRERYQFLSGWVHESNRVSMNWLRWLGFAVTQEGVTVNGHVFYKFNMDCRT